MGNDALSAQKLCFGSHNHNVVVIAGYASQTPHIKLDCSFFRSTTFWDDNILIVHFKLHFLLLMLCATMPAAQLQGIRDVSWFLQPLCHSCNRVFPSWCMLGPSS